MYAKLIVLLAALAVVTASPAGVEVKAAVKKDSLARRKAMKARTKTVRSQQMKRGGMRRPKAATSVSYVNFMAYATSGCGTLLSEVQYGTGICVGTTAFGAASDASSTMLSWASGILTQTFYSDSACSTSIQSYVVVNTTGMTSGTCDGDVMYTTSTSWSLPSGAGFYMADYNSEANCNSASQPFYSDWVTTSYTTDDIDDAEFDDDLTFDDDIVVDLTCFASSVTNLLEDDDSYTDFTTTGTYATWAFTSSSSSSKSSCFAGSETVEMASGEVVAISEVKMGDRILGSDAKGNTVYSEVIAVPHARNTESAVFTHLETASGKDIKMTPEHLVMVSKACDASTELVQAGEVAPGMCLMTTSGLDNVKATSEASSNGIYSVVLQDAEMVVVNGVVASPFAVNHAVANAYYNVVRAFPASLLSLPVLKQANLLFGSIVASFGL